MNNPKELCLEDFIYPLEDSLIAQNPLEHRKDSKLLIRECTGGIQHMGIQDLESALPENALVILNDSRVFPSRVLGRLATGGKVELFLLRELPQKNRWLTLGNPSKKLKNSTEIILDSHLNATIESVLPGQTPKTFEISLTPPDGFHQWLDQNGFVPLPPYIKRDQPEPAPKSPDRVRYQTVYAKNTGSVAAPTAGLHFCDERLDALRKRGIQISYVTLHVGAGTFLPVKDQDIAKHKMHSEAYSIPKETYDAIQQAKNERRPIICVGTTSFRCLESFYADSSAPKRPDQLYETDLFIYPRNNKDRYQPKIAQGLMTNFHQPGSTLFMLISALIGLDQAKHMYREAQQQSYRFLSYGDSSLLWL